MGRKVWQSRHMVAGNCVEQLGQVAPVAKVSKRARHFPHTQKGPTGGEAWQTGQVNSGRRGIFSSRERINACRKPTKQFSPMKTSNNPNQIADSPAPPRSNSTVNRPTTATPQNPIIEAIIKLFARPNKNQSNERRICPPSKG